MLLGLSAVYMQCGQEKALPMMIRLADWFGYQVLDKLTDEQVQRLLVCEQVLSMNLLLTYMNLLVKYVSWNEPGV